MGSRDSVQKGHEENIRDAAKASDSETVIVIRPENLPSWDSSTSHGSVVNMKHSGKGIASNHVAVESEIGFQLAQGGGGEASGLSNPGGQADVVANAIKLETLVSVQGEYETKCDLIGLRKMPNMIVSKSEGGKTSCIIDVKYGDQEGSGSTEKVCRICHLDSDLQEPEIGSKIRRDVIELGCGCKGELGYAHSHCAAAWFQMKGNRLCEICGQSARNVAGIIADHRFMEQWNESRLNGEGANSSERGAGCWQGQPFCNLLMACLVISFVLPWFLRVNIF